MLLEQCLHRAKCLCFFCLSCLEDQSMFVIIETLLTATALCQPHMHSLYTSCGGQLWLRGGLNSGFTYWQCSQTDETIANMYDAVHLSNI